MIAMERPFRAARIAERYPAGPLPIMIKSNCWVEDSIDFISFQCPESLIRLDIFYDVIPTKVGIQKGNTRFLLPQE
jgi:hypothetical protein